MSKPSTNFIHLCDAATIDGGGKLNILGIFSVIYLQSVPSSFPKFTTVVSVSLEKMAEKNTLEIKITGPTGKEITINPAIKVDFNIPENSKKKPELNLILDITNMVFEQFGEHSLDVLINGTNIGDKKFIVEERKEK